MTKKPFFVDVLNIVSFVDSLHEDKSISIASSGTPLFLNDCRTHEKHQFSFWVSDALCPAGSVTVSEFFTFLMILLSSKCWISLAKAKTRTHLMRYFIEFD